MLYKPYLSFFSLIYAVASVYASGSGSLTVDTDIGSFQGSHADNGIERWLGLPFAQPPVGKLRFKAPVAITERAHGVTNASTFKDACPQPIASLGAPIGEDCLGLNVYRPEGTTSDSKLPVLFWIHVSIITTKEIISLLD